jgi:hypothetical protein
MCWATTSGLQLLEVVSVRWSSGHQAPLIQLVKVLSMCKVEKDQPAKLIKRTRVLS